jgi:hypothetical protein
MKRRCIADGRLDQGRVGFPAQRCTTEHLPLRRGLRLRNRSGCDHPAHDPGPDPGRYDTGPHRSSDAYWGTVMSWMRRSSDVH